MDGLCDHIDNYKGNRHLVISHEKFIDSPWDHSSSRSKKRKEIQKSNQKRHKDKISCVEDPQSHKQDQEYDPHDLKLGFKIPANGIPQIVHHESHSFLYRLRRDSFHPGQYLLALNDKEISRKHSHNE